jgi:hypothetical protein
VRPRHPTAIRVYFLQDRSQIRLIPGLGYSGILPEPPLTLPERLRQLLHSTGAVGAVAVTITHFQHKHGDCMPSENILRRTSGQKSSNFFALFKEAFQHWFDTPLKLFLSPILLFRLRHHVLRRLNDHLGQLPLEPFIVVAMVDMSRGDKALAMIKLNECYTFHNFLTERQQYPNPSTLFM